jgi:acyl-CoA thioester hydrolase
MIEAPFKLHRGQVRAEWTDENRHMNLAYYLVMFDAASDAVFEVLRIGQAYRRAVGRTCFAAETHLVYEQEMNQADWAEIATTVVDVDEKRLHLAHEMYREGGVGRVCLQEILFVNVDLATRRAAVWGDQALAWLAAVRDAHARVERPAKIGRSIRIQK